MAEYVGDLINRAYLPISDRVQDEQRGSLTQIFDNTRRKSSTLANRNHADRKQVRARLQATAQRQQLQHVFPYSTSYLYV